MSNNSLYYRHETLGAFLATCSYYDSGAKIIAQHLRDQGIASINSILDVGCGEGTFTRTFLKELKRTGIAPPRTILGIDPDQANIDSYANLVRQETGLIADTRTAGLENVDFKGHFALVLSSHSLYATMESAHMSGAEKARHINRVLEATASGGVCYLSLSSNVSIAYRVKRDVLALVGQHEDLSAYGEELAGYLQSARVPLKTIANTSYCDITRLIDDFDFMIHWCSYLCRVPEERLRDLGFKVLRSVFERHALSFDQANPTERQRMLDSPSTLGLPRPGTIYVPHAELCFFLNF